MKMVLTVLAVLVGLVFAGPIFSADKDSKSTTKSPMSKTGQKEPSKAIEVGNKICPVSGEKVPVGKEVKIEHKGKIYNLCCKMCEKDFRKDPEKYIKKLESQKK